MGPSTFLTGTQWKDWNGRLVVGIMGGQFTFVLELDAAGMTIGHQTVNLPMARPRSLVQGPDGNLYLVTDSASAGEIWRIVPN